MPEGIIEYLKENDRIPVGGRSEMATPEYILEVENVEKRFGELVAVNDVSFGIERGAFVGLIGPNGAGKSTLFNDYRRTIADVGSGVLQRRGHHRQRTTQER